MTDLIELAIKAVQIYAERHPRPTHVNQQQAADMIGKSTPTIRKMIRSGDIATNRLGLIPMSEIDRLLAPKKTHEQAETAP